MSLLFFLDSLGSGGAERQFSIVAKGLADRGHDVCFITVYPGGQHWLELEGCANLRLASLYPRTPKGKGQKALQLLIAPVLLRQKIVRENISIVYSSLYISNLIAGLSVFSLKDVKLIWGIRTSNIGMNWKKASLFHCCRLISNCANFIIPNSYSGLSYMHKTGFRVRQHEVIPNGIDSYKFRPDKKLRQTMRVKWGISENSKLVGFVGRIDPVKDHMTFLLAASILVKKKSGVKFICIGGSSKSESYELRHKADALGIKDHVIWRKNITDIESAYNAFDIFCSSSLAEGFSNVIGEAMACGKRCVVTDVGDSKYIVGNIGCVVPCRDPKALADAIETQLLQNSNAYCKEARNRILENFSIEKLLDKTERVLASL